MRSELVENAKDIANNIAKELIKELPGQTVTKADIRFQYSIPYNKSVSVFTALRLLGFEVTRTEVHVPSAFQDSSS